MKTWNQTRNEITSVNEAEKQEIRQMAHLVAQIIERRQVLGLTQKQLAVRAGLRQEAVARLESARTMPRIDTLLRISNSLEDSVNKCSQKPI